MTKPQLSGQSTTPQVVAAISAAAAQIPAQRVVIGQDKGKGHDTASAFLAVVAVFDIPAAAAGLAVSEVANAIWGEAAYPGPENGQPGLFWPGIIQIGSDTVQGIQNSGSSQTKVTSGSDDHFEVD